MHKILYYVMNIFITKISLSRIKLFLVINSVIFLSSCTIIDNNFCKQSGYISGTYEYYACEERYNEDPASYKYCSDIYNFRKESPAQEQCIREKIPGNRKTFDNDKDKCLSESKRMFSVKILYPLLFAEYNEKNISDELVKTQIFDNEEAANLIMLNERKLYVDSCLKEKGWQKSLQFFKYDFDGLNWKYLN